MCQFFLSKCRDWKMHLHLDTRKTQVYFNILSHQNFKEIFENLPTHQKWQNDVLHANMNMDVSPYRHIIYICIVRPNWGIHHAAWKCVSQTEKQLKHKLRLNPVSIRILKVLTTRSNISKPIFITLRCVGNSCWSIALL